MAFFPASSLVSSLCRSESLVSSFSPPVFSKEAITTCLSDLMQRVPVTESRSPAAGGEVSQPGSMSFLPAMSKAFGRKKLISCGCGFLVPVQVSWHSKHEPRFRTGFESCCLRKFNSLTAAGLLPVLEW